jgi:hypothetical protein
MKVNFQLKEIKIVDAAEAKDSKLETILYEE